MRSQLLTLVVAKPHVARWSPPYVCSRARKSSSLYWDDQHLRENRNLTRKRGAAGSSLTRRVVIKATGSQEFGQRTGAATSQPELLPIRLRLLLLI